MSWVYSSSRRFRYSTQGLVVQELTDEGYVTLPPVPKNFKTEAPKKKPGRPMKTFSEEYSWGTSLS
jgi:hypothetical protein